MLCSETVAGMFVSPTLRVLFGKVTDSDTGQTRFMLPVNCIPTDTLEESFSLLVGIQFEAESDDLEHTIRTIAVDRHPIHIAQCHVPEDHPMLSVNPDRYQWLEPQFFCDARNEQWFVPDTWKTLVAFRNTWAFHNEPVSSAV